MLKQAAYSKISGDGRFLFNPFSENEEFFEEVDVCIFTEGTYPFVKGGVSSVIHDVIKNLPDKTFGIVYIGWNQQADFVKMYPDLDHLKWVYPVFLSNANLKKSSSHFSEYFKWKTNKSADFFEIISLLKNGFNGESKDLYYLYKNYFNPLTRKVSIKEVLENKSFFNILIKEFTESKISLNDFFWMKKEFVSLALAILDKVYPLAKVYHSHSSGYAGLAASVASLQNNVNFFLTEHSLYTRDILKGIDKIFTLKSQDVSNINIDILKNKFKKDVWKNWFKKINEINYSCCSMSSYLYKQISEDAVQLGAKPEKIKIIPNGLNYDQFSYVRHQQKKRHKIRFKDENFQWKLAIIARVVPVKGILDLIQIISILKKEDPDLNFKLDIIGPMSEDPLYTEECYKTCRRLNLQSVITFKGTQNIFECLPEVDLMLLSSKSEAFPMAVLEGMASSIPVVSTDVGSVQYILSDELKIDNETLLAAGEVVSQGDFSSFAKSIIRILRSNDLYESYRTNGPLRIQNCFQLDKVVNMYNFFYDKLGKKQ